MTVGLGLRKRLVTKTNYSYRNWWEIIRFSQNSVEENNGEWRLFARGGAVRKMFNTHMALFTNIRKGQIQKLVLIAM